MSRNANGRGTIRKRKDGRWEARYTVGADPKTGRQIQKSIYGKTQKEVRKKLTEITNTLDKGLYVDSDKVTVQSWLETYVIGKVKWTTYCSYEKDCRVHIIPNLGRIQLQALRAPMIQDFYNGRLEYGLSEKSVKNLHGVLHRALGKARQVGYINTNPADDCELPKIMKKEIKPLSSEKVREFITAVKNHRYRDIYLVTLFTGIRQGEALGLTWDCVDFKKGTIFINKQLQLVPRSGGQYKLLPTKSCNIRTLYPSAFVMNILRDLWSLDVKYNQWNLVFVKEDGTHLARGTVYKDYKKLVRALEIPETRFHDLRHTFAVIALQEKVDIKTVQRTLGHATVAFTLDIYGHVSEEMQEDSKKRIDKYIENLA